MPYRNGIDRFTVSIVSENRLPTSSVITISAGVSASPIIGATVIAPVVGSTRVADVPRLLLVAAEDRSRFQSSRNVGTEVK